MQLGGTDTATEPRAGFAAWWMVGVLLAFYILSYCDRIIVVMMTEQLKADLRLTDVQLSLILGPAFALCYAVAGFPLGWAADRLSRRWVVWGGVSVWSLATMACGLATSFGALFAARALVGVGEASLSPAAYSLIADRFPRRRMTTALSVFTMGPKAGAAVAYAVGAAAITIAGTIGAVEVPGVGALKPWQIVFAMVGGPGLLLALLCFTFREPGRRGAAAKSSASLGEFLIFAGRHRLVLGLLMVGFSLMAVTSGAVMNWVPAYMTRHFGWTAAQYGPVLSISSALAAITLPLKGVIVDWLYARGVPDAHLRFYTWTMAFVIPVATVSALLGGPIAYLLCIAAVEVVGLTYVLYMSAMIQMLVPGDMRGRMTGLFLFVITILGMGTGPTITASVTDYVFGDPGMVGYSIALVSTVAMSLALILFRISLRLIRPLIVAQRETPSVPEPAVATTRT